MVPFTFQQLRILKAIAAEKTFTKAAHVLYLSQPSLSKQIKNLEHSLGVMLINRKKNEISLTEEGRIFLQYAERILALSEESCRALRDLHNKDRGNLKIGASKIIGSYLLPRILALFTPKHPQINLQISINSTRLIAKHVINQKIDVAIVGGEIPNELKKDLIIEPFVKDELRLIISPENNQFADKKTIKKENLYLLNFIKLSSNSIIQKHIDNILLQNGTDINQLKIIMEFDSIEGIKNAVSLGLGAAFVSKAAIEKEVKLKTLKVLKIENLQILFGLSIITNSKSYQSNACNVFYDELLKLRQSIEY